MTRVVLRRFSAARILKPQDREDVGFLQGIFVNLPIKNLVLWPHYFHNSSILVYLNEDLFCLF